MRVLFTGFEVFGEHEFNPSAVVAEEAARELGATFELLAVDFETARRAAESTADYDLVIHVGLAAATPWVRLERYAHNIRMAVEDASQERDPDAVLALEEGGPLALETSVDVARIRKGLAGRWDVRHSRDAGTYICNATYFWSMRLAPDTDTLFVHVPAWDADTAAGFGRDLASALRDD